MKRLLTIITIIISAVTNLSAVRYQITALNTPTITIGGKSLKKGDIFDGKSNIKWANDSQCMEVKNLQNYELHSFSAKVFKSKGAVLTIEDYFLNTSIGSSRGVKGNYIFTKSKNSNNYPEKRIALVLGNSNYENLSYLRNAQKDASDISDALLQIGFDVLEGYECKYSDLMTALNNFASRAKDYDVVLFYYAGHGLQNNNHNYLIPIERKLDKPSELIDGCVNCDDVLYKIESTGADTKIIFFDACRNTKNNWARDATQGLARMEGPVGSVILFSTQSGKIALDGEGNNSPFAESIIKNIKLTDISANEAITGLIKDTFSATGKSQYPMQIGTIISDFKFNPRSTKPFQKTSQPVQKANQPVQKTNQTVQKANQNTSVSQGFSGMSSQQIYERGMSLLSDGKYNESVKWFLEAAGRGHAASQYCLGTLYFTGNGVTKNHKEAFNWLKKAADQKEADSYYPLGMLYKTGSGGIQNYYQAFHYFLQSAQTKNSNAYYELGNLYKDGLGTNKDLNEAIKWYQKAADQGNVSAGIALKKCKSLVTANSANGDAGNLTIKGNVTDENGEPLIGATVVVVGENRGIATDLDGNYVLKDVKEGSTIRISYIGYKPMEFKAVRSNTTPKVKMR